MGMRIFVKNWREIWGENWGEILPDPRPKGGWKEFCKIEY